MLVGLPSLSDVTNERRQLRLQLWLRSNFALLLLLQQCSITEVVSCSPPPIHSSMQSAFSRVLARPPATAVVRGRTGHVHHCYRAVVPECFHHCQCSSIANPVVCPSPPSALHPLPVRSQPPSVPISLFHVLHAIAAGTRTPTDTALPPCCYAAVPPPALESPPHQSGCLLLRSSIHALSPQSVRLSSPSLPRISSLIVVPMLRGSTHTW